MGYDDIIPLLGEFGRYQRRIYLLLCLPAILCAFHKMGLVFVQAEPNYRIAADYRLRKLAFKFKIIPVGLNAAIPVGLVARKTKPLFLIRNRSVPNSPSAGSEIVPSGRRCQLVDEFPNATYTLAPDILNYSFPVDAKTQKYSSCDMFVSGTNGTAKCTSYIYDHSKYSSSTLIEWNLVCGRAYITAIGDAIFMLGVMVGSILFGELSDRLGRKPIFFISLVIQVIFGVLAAIAPEFWTYTISRCVIGMSTSGVFLVAYVIAMEMVGPSYRLFAGVVVQMFFSLGYMLTAGLAYLFPEWRHLQLALTLPGVVFFCYWWFIPESARWLVTKNRVQEATTLIQRAAKENNVKIDDAHLESLLVSEAKSKDDNVKKATILDIFRHRRMRNRSFIIFFDWLANSMTYYGLSWNIKNLGGNDYLNFVISGAVEIPAYTFLLFTLNRWGRKSILCGCMVTAGVSLLATMAVPISLNWLTVTLAMIGKLAITASYGTIYIFSVEQFPTVIRNAGLGAGSTSARAGAILAPLINLTSEAWKPLPLIIFGILTLFGGCLSLLLPETLNKKLPETIEDGEKFGTKEAKNEEETQRLTNGPGDEKNFKEIELQRLNGDAEGPKLENGSC